LFFFLLSRNAKEEFDYFYWNLSGRKESDQSLSFFMEFVSVNMARYLLKLFFQSFLLKKTHIIL